MAINRDEFPVAFAEDGSVVVNFGIVAGREATQAELDRLALAFREAGAGAEMTITAERRQEYGHEFEGVVHQVRVTLRGSPPEWVEAICAARRDTPDGAVLSRIPVSRRGEGAANRSIIVNAAVVPLRAAGARSRLR